MQAIEQKTDTWHEWRARGLGSSDASTIMEAEGAFQTPLKLWEQRTGRAPQTESNWAMERGIRLEPEARAKYELLHDIDMPAALAVNKNNEIFRASLDGVNYEKGIVLEIKCPGEKDHNTALAGSIPEKYQWQLIHQLMVTDLELAHYFSYKDGEGKLIEFKRDREREKLLIEKELKFWECIQKDTPPEPSEKDFTVIKDKATVEIAETYKAMKLELDAQKAIVKSLEAELEKVENQLTGIAGDRRIICAGVQVRKITRIGTVDYKAIPQLKGVDLEQFRKKPSIYYDVKLKK